MVNSLYLTLLNQRGSWYTHLFQLLKNTHTYAVLTLALLIYIWQSSSEKVKKAKRNGKKQYKTTLKWFLFSLDKQKKMESSLSGWLTSLTSDSSSCGMEDHLCCVCIAGMHNYCSLPALLIAAWQEQPCGNMFLVSNVDAKQHLLFVVLLLFLFKNAGDRFNGVMTATN